eukprot:15461409-Alexandrium_andersonii.AAC.2
MSGLPRSAYSCPVMGATGACKQVIGQCPWNTLQELEFGHEGPKEQGKPYHAEGAPLGDGSRPGVPPSDGRR